MISTTLTKSLHVIEILAASKRPRGISELAKEAELNKSAVQRIFKTLETAGYLEKEDGGSRYRLTLKFWQLGMTMIDSHDMRRQIHPILRFAAERSRQTVFLVTLDFPNVVYLDRVEGEKGRSNASEPGRTLPVHVTASGKAILAFMDTSDRQRVYDEFELEDETAGLEQELGAIRDAGFSTSKSGAISDVNSVAAPIWNQDGKPVGSICITGDSSAMSEPVLTELSDLVVKLASQATDVVGGQDPRKAFSRP